MLSYYVISKDVTVKNRTLKIVSPKSDGNNCLLQCFKMHLGKKGNQMKSASIRKELGIYEGKIHFTMVPLVASYFGVGHILMNDKHEILSQSDPESENCCHIMLSARMLLLKIEHLTLKIVSPKSDGNNCLLQCFKMHLGKKGNQMKSASIRKELGIYEGKIHFTMVPLVASYFGVGHILMNDKHEILSQSDPESENCCHIMLSARMLLLKIEHLTLKIVSPKSDGNNCLLQCFKMHLGKKGNQMKSASIRKELGIYEGKIHFTMVPLVASYFGVGHILMNDKHEILSQSDPESENCCHIMLSARMLLLKIEH